MSRARAVAFDAQRLTLHWRDDGDSRLLAIWLRDHCRCPECRDPNNGQRLLNVTDIPADIAIADARLDGDYLHVEFAPDGHRSVYAVDWLWRNARDRDPPVDDRSASGKTLWRADSFARGLPRTDYTAFDERDAARRDALRAVRDLGFVLIDALPDAPGQVLRVIERFGFVRETNYGRLFDVRAEIDPNNLAYSRLGLGAHLDNPYRNPVPGLQLLHCLESSAEGGETILLDGFAAAALLREENPDHFALLGRERVNFRFRDARADLRSRVPLIEVDDRGEVSTVRFNNRSIDTIRLPPERMAAFYAAYRHFAGILERDELQVRLRLQPGQMLLFDNTRVLHARSAFTAAGRRWLQGAYSDLDGLYSSLALLEAGT